MEAKEPGMNRNREWNRVRFKTSIADYRPVLFPPPGPYWCTGTESLAAQSGECSILVAFIPRGDDILQFWPEAYDLDEVASDGIQFSDRFPRPDWFEEGVCES